MDAGLEVLNLGDGEIGIIHAHAVGALLNVDEAIFVSVHQRTKQHAANEAEDRGVRADAECQSPDNGERETLGARERAKREPQILNEQH